MDQKRLPRTAYELKEGETFVPLTYGQTLSEFTFKSVIAGAFLGVLFGAANTYLGLKAGLTISTSIPIAVLTVVFFRAMEAAGKPGTILELNMSQTVGSASSSVASGVIFTIPALFMWEMAPGWGQMTLLAMAGGLLGVLAMIPLRRYLIKQEHGKLLYPEGMACAEVLVAATQRGRRAVGVFWGLGIGMFFKLLTEFKLIKEEFALPLLARAKLDISVSPGLIGVGYILGIRIASVMVAGSAISALVIIPIIYLLFRGAAEPLFPDLQAATVKKLVGEMQTGEIWSTYVRYIGAGAVATGGIITLVKSIPTMIASFKLGIANLRRDQTGENDSDARLDRDLSFRTVAIFALAVLAVLIFVPGILGRIDNIGVRAVAAVLVAVFAFFFVTVSSRIVGIVGVTSNPTSGMTIAAVIGTTFIFYTAGWTGPTGMATALMVGTAVCIAASIAGDTSQDLKTGFVLGATPRFQQIGELLGVITSAGAVCFVIGVLHRGTEGGLGGANLAAPQATLIKLIIQGVMDQNLPWSLLAIGVVMAIIAAAFRLPVLAFAVGVYLPLHTMAAVFMGGVIRWWVTRVRDKNESERRREQGTLAGSGCVGGEGLTGVIVAASVVIITAQGKELIGFPLVDRLFGLGGTTFGAVLDEVLALAAIVGIMGLIAWQAKRRLNGGGKSPEEKRPEESR